MTLAPGDPGEVFEARLKFLGTYNYVSLSFVGFGNRKKKMKT